MRYADRRSAGQLLGRELAGRHYGTNVIVMGLPRGGVPVAYETARALRAPLDVLIVRKLGSPTDPELALGALASGDIVVENTDVLQYVDRPRAALDLALARERKELVRREHAYRGGMPPVHVAGRTVILVDDGAATGASMLAAVRSLQSRAAGKIIVALPVASAEAIDRLRAETDTVVCLQVPDSFAAVGGWYESFPQVEDSEVTSLMADARAHHHAAEPVDGRVESP